MLRLNHVAWDKTSETDFQSSNVPRANRWIKCDPLGPGRLNDLLFLYPFL